MSPHIDNLRKIAAGIPEIPANEQGIGYLHMAVMEAIKETANELERLNKILGMG